ncbi:proteasome 26S subunit [Capsaspora owczarzaki ATCC 30864]|uniref:Proteasome 26S subunit n=1 Tax=Capsaspora owczarzaki (strain ATCC 30864) TaxID=595528 RepID=A0A0D2WSY0_CAPO3|nr:proteasome 26S subunit [Capsaspora owczarzaki ATCC 30864]KJE95440.1 proteasome 26S subunit [Capsaspora owczarzaki ATCC 30864]|eukprot:XP_004345480.1 proteasome 26S subunit [Capsaspora owczarzaki ATCC 30864]
MAIDVAAFFGAQRNADAAHAAEWTTLEDYYNRKLWHQLSIKLFELLSDPTTPTSLDIYNNFLLDFANKLNQLTLVDICLIIVNRMTDAHAAVEFLRMLAEKVKRDNAAYITTTMVIADLHIGPALAAPATTKELLEEVGALLETMDHVDLRIFSSYYRVAASYNKVKGSFSEFYKDTLLFLGCTDLATLPIAEQQVRAFDLALAALLADDIYNFGELLVHPVLDSLRSTEHAWLVDLLFAFNSGNIAKFQQLAPHWRKQSDLAAHEKKLTNKLALLALLELVFQRPADTRTVSFQEIAQHTVLNVSDVEHLLMKALAAGLIRGSLDGVSQAVSITWVQPRVLNTAQVADMRDRLAQWCRRVSEVSSLVESDASELIV